ncbi:MAG: hypothetical protein ABSF89_10940 [Acidimicrobiales bacterium]|jgi:hypothetical protein
MNPASRLRVLALIVVGLFGGGLLVPALAAAGPARPETGQSWSASTPNVAGAPITSLVAVTCVSAADCWAVGDRFQSSSSNAGPALIEHYVNGDWTTTAAGPAQSGTLDELSGVSCLSATDCWAVGMRSGSHPGNLLEHYGTHGGWTAVNTPAPQGELSAVTCEPANGECWAVGSSGNSGLAATFRLFGGSWRYVRAAPLSVSFVQVSGVACAAEDECLLVGYVTPKHGAGQALAERWNGRGWSAVTVSGQLSGGGSLAGVDCLPGSSPVTCWAVGQTVTKGLGLIAIHPLVERWDGSSFTSVHSPAGSAGNYPELKAIACAAVTACQAVGSRGAGEDEALVLTEGWNGSSWSAETSPSPLYGFQSLTGVACPSAKGCWAVGEGLNHTGSGSRMIIEHFTVST